MTSDIAVSGAACTTGATPSQVVQLSSENDKVTTTFWRVPKTLLLAAVDFVEYWVLESFQCVWQTKKARAIPNPADSLRYIFCKQ